MNKKVLVGVLLVVAIVAGGVYFVGGGSQMQGRIRLVPPPDVVAVPVEKLNISANTQSLDTYPKNQMKIAGFTVNSMADATDNVTSKAVLKKIRVWVYAENFIANNFKLYPANKYSDYNYIVEGKIVDKNILDSKVAIYAVEFDLTSNSKLVADGGEAEIPENTSKDFSIQADTVSGFGGTMSLDIRMLGTDKNAVYGNDSEVEWFDGINASAWMDQAESSVHLRDLTISASTGTVDYSNF